jgi:4a-hydroxytetrahydrobiopterin dehydratase
MALMNDAEIRQGLKILPGWIRQGDELKKKFEFKNFVQAMDFVNSIALLAERANHHPDIDIRWNKVQLALSTHSSGGITEKDIVLAKEIESIQK